MPENVGQSGDLKAGVMELLKSLFAVEDLGAEGKTLSNEGLESRGKGFLENQRASLATIFANNPLSGNAKKPSAEDLMFIEAMRKDFLEKQLMKMMLERQQAMNVQNQFNPGVVPRRFGGTGMD